MGTRVVGGPHSGVDVRIASIRVRNSCAWGWGDVGDLLCGLLCGQARLSQQLDDLNEQDLDAVQRLVQLPERDVE